MSRTANENAVAAEAIRKAVQKFTDIAPPLLRLGVAATLLHSVMLDPEATTMERGAGGTAYELLSMGVDACIAEAKAHG